MIGPEPCPSCRFLGSPDPDCDICHGTGNAIDGFEIKAWHVGVLTLVALAFIVAIAWAVIR